MADTPQTGTDPAQGFPIAIIGAGFAGIGAAIRLKQAGILSFTIYERAAEIGGTWRDNTYPGAACDVPSHVYSFSFEPNPDWSRKFGGAAEIQSYLLRTVDKHRLRPHLRLGTAIVDARFDEDAGLWTLVTGDGERVHARAVISGVGGLVDPAMPDIAGLDDFGGTWFHTARWNHDFDLEGKRVAVIGTGASAIQVVPQIAPKVAKLDVFQRSAAWIMPKRDKPVSERTKRWFRRFPQLQRAMRSAMFWLSEMMGPIVILDSPLSKLGEWASKRHLEASVRDPELRRKLTPDFQFGCKRVLISDDYWPSLERDNVELVTDGIVRITRNGIETRDGGEREYDAIIFATGFALGLAAAPFPVSGLGGRTLDDAWKNGATAYKGVTVANFPNWFMIMGPNTGPGHTSVLIYTEAQIHYIVQAVRRMIADDIKYLSVRPELQRRYNELLQDRMRHTVWASGCNSWYLSPDGSNHALYPGFASEYCARIRKFKIDDYETVTF